MWWRVQQVGGGFMEALRRLPGGDSMWGLLVWFSAIATLMALVVMRLTMRPDRVARARNRALARLIEFRLYQHELTSIFAIFGRVLSAVAKYLWLWLPPLAVLGLVLAPLFAQAVLRFQYRPYRPGEVIEIKAWARRPDALRALSLEWPERAGLEMVGVPFRSLADQEAVWRVRASQVGVVTVRVAVAGFTPVAKEVVIGSDAGIAPLAPFRVAADKVKWGMALREAPWPGQDPVERVEVKYPPREWRIGFVRIHWILACFMLCIMMGLALKPVLGVEF